MRVGICIGVYSLLDAKRLKKLIYQYHRFFHDQVYPYIICTSEEAYDYYSRINFPFKNFKTILASNQLLDFGAYFEAMNIFLSQCYDGGFFLNDTYFYKHFSFPSSLELIEKSTHILGNQERFDRIPCIIGPVSKSEFEFKHSTINHISSYCFFLNSYAIQLMSAHFSQLEASYFELKALDKLESVYSHPLAFGSSFYLSKRRGWENINGEIMKQKLMTVILERSLVQVIRDSGLIWYVGSGNRGKIESCLKKVIGSFTYFTRIYFGS